MSKQTFEYLIGGIFALVIAMGIGRFSYTVILPYMQETFAFSRATAGFLATSNYLGYLVGALVAGRLQLADKRIPFFTNSTCHEYFDNSFHGLYRYHYGLVCTPVSFRRNERVYLCSCC